MNNSMNDLMNLISVLCGGYCLYTTAQIYS